VIGGVEMRICVLHFDPPIGGFGVRRYFKRYRRDIHVSIVDK
jgi:hypothetical protein